MKKRAAKKKTAKKKRRDRAPPPPAAPAAAAVDQLVVLMATGLAADALRQHALEKLELPPVLVDHAIAEARARITLAAEYNRDEELGAAITRLADCYKAARSDRDIRTALSCQRELNKLLRLYQAPEPTGADDPDTDAAGAMLRQHLLPLGIATEDDTTEEIARQAVAEIVRLRTQVHRAQKARR